MTISRFFARHSLSLLLSFSLLLLAFSLLTPSGLEPDRAPWKKGGVIRVGAPQPVRQASVISPYGPGIESELVEQFCAEASCTVEWVNVAHKEEGFALLQADIIDVLVGFWGNAPEKNPDPGGASPPDIHGGLAYAHFNPIHIKGIDASQLPASRSPESDVPAPPSPSVMAALSSTFSSLIPALVSADPLGQTEEATPYPVFKLLEDAPHAGETVLMDPASYALWLPFMGDVSGRKGSEKTPYRWFWRDDASTLSQRLEAFWKDPARVEHMAEMTERYFGFMPPTLRQQDILELANTLAERLPAYEEFIERAAKETGVPPLLLVAAIYQESRFDPEATSVTRVRGIMQLTQSTARMLKVDRRDPEQCIMGGARYLRDLYEQTEGRAETEWDRWFMALAAYNQGPGNLSQSIKIAKRLGGEGTTWSDLKKSYPLARNCRGLEARSFVEKIRYYHFILHGLVALAPRETQDFAPLLSLALGGSGN